MSGVRSSAPIPCWIIQEGKVFHVTWIDCVEPIRGPVYIEVHGEEIRYDYRYGRSPHKSIIF